MAHSTFACCQQGCAHVVCFEPDVEARLRRTHETWTCPAGHPQHFAGKTEQEKKIERLEHWLAYAKEEAEMWCTKALEARRTCDWPACGVIAASRGGLITHMQRSHGMPTLAEAVEAKEATADA